MGKLIFSSTALMVAGGFLLVACCIFSCGGILIFAVAKDYSADATEIKGLADISATGDGQKAYLTDTIANAQAITNDSVLGNISKYNLVGYEVDRWDVSRSSSSSGSSNTRRTTYSGTWTDVSSRFTPFQLGTVTVQPDDTMKLEGSVFEVIIPGKGGNGNSDTYNGQSLQDGSYRLQGYRNGDRVTVVGIRHNASTMSSERVFGGTRDELVSHLESQANSSRNFGFAALACGFCFLIPGLAIGGASIYGRRWFNKSSPTIMPVYGQTPPVGTFGSGPVNTTMPYGSPATPPSNIPSDSVWGGSAQPSSTPSPFDPPANAPSPFDKPKDESPFKSPFDDPPLQ